MEEDNEEELVEVGRRDVLRLLRVDVVAGAVVEEGVAMTIEV